MQPHRYLNELDHWRNISQRPDPSSPPLSPTIKPTTSMSKEEQPKSSTSAAATITTTSDPFAVEGSRGWLEYGATTVSEKTTTSSSSHSSGSNSRSHDSHHQQQQMSRTTTQPGIEVSLKKKGKEKVTKNTIHDSQQQQQKAKELLAVSNEDILNLTKMTAHLPDRTTNTSSSGGSNSSSHKYHHHHRRVKPKEDRTFSSTEHLPTISTSTLNNNNNNNSSNVNNNYPSPTRPSVSTPSPSNRNTNNLGSTNENRRSWYKHLIKRDKGKNRTMSLENNEASFMIRDGSHHSSNNSSAMTTTTTGSGGSNIIIDTTKQFMSAHHHPISVAAPTSESSSDDGMNQHIHRKFSTPMAMKQKGIASQQLPQQQQHRRTSSEAAKMIAPSTSSPNHKHPSKLQFQRRHSLDSIRTPDDTPLFSSPELISSGHNNNILASDVLHHHDDTDQSDDNVKKSEEIASNRSSVAYGAITSEEEEEKGRVSGEPQEEEKHILLDYDTLPPEVLGLLREYEKQGKIQIEDRRVKIYKDEEEEEDLEEDIVDASDLVSSITIPYDSADDNESIMTKRIATVRASRSDRAEFVKLVHLTDGNSMKNVGYLLDLHVSILGDEIDDEENNHSEDMQMLLGKVDRRIEALQKLTQDSKQFMNENKQAMDALTFHDDGHESFHSPWPSPANSNSRQTSSKSIHSIKEAAAAVVEEEIKKKRSAFSLQTQSSSTTTTTLSSTCSSSPNQQRRPSSSIRRAASSFLLDPHVSHDLPYNSVNPFDYRQEEVRLGVSALESEMTEFKRELQMTEELIRDIQIDINDTRQRMSSYIKDIPETHYSALKKLEVDVESILANRAKNPWLDTGYALLSYLLTLFALLVWIIICILKWGRTVVLFPRKLWRTYTEYLIERDRAVKKASLRSVSTGSLHLDPNAPSPPPPPNSNSSRHHYPRHRPNTSSFMLSSSSSSIGASSTSSSSTSSRPKSRIVHPSLSL